MVHFGGTHDSQARALGEPEDLMPSRQPQPDKPSEWAYPIDPDHMRNLLQVSIEAMRKIAQPGGSMHGYWDSIFDAEDLLRKLGERLSGAALKKVRGIPL